MSEETKHDGDAVQSEDALASFNNELKGLQDKYSFRLIAVPSIKPDGTIGGTLQVIDTNKIVLPDVLSPYVEGDELYTNGKN